MVQDKPYFHEVWDEIRLLLDGKLLVAHNAAFDIPILLNLIEKKQLGDFDHRYICTLELARKILKRQVDKFSLENLCQWYRIPYGNHNGAKDTISTLLLLNSLLREKYREDYQYDRLLKPKVYEYTMQTVSN